MDLGIDGRVALVVGGNGYIGRAIVERLRAEGAQVVVAARSEGVDVRMDTTDAASVDASFAEVLARHGRLDIVVVSAAPSARTLTTDTLFDPEVALANVETKAIGFLRVAQAAIPYLTEGGWGRIIAINGQNAFLTGNLVGSMRNAALLLAAKNLADAEASGPVTINTVNPGPVVDAPSTAITRGVPGESSPEQIAAVVAFLASEFAGTISGEAISTGHKVAGFLTD